MIPRLYKKDCTDFASNGEGLLKDAYDWDIMEEHNGDFTCDFKYPSNGPLAKLLEVGNIVKAHASKRLKNQKFRIYKVEKSQASDAIFVYARHKSFTLNYDFIPTTIDTVSAQKCEYALNLIFKNSINHKHYKGYSDILNPQTFKIGFKTPGEAIQGTEGSIIDTYGNGPHIVRDNSTEDAIYVLSDRGVSNNILIAYGKNMSGFTASEDSSDIITRIVPFVNSGDTIVRPSTFTYVDAPNIDDYDIVYTREVDLSEKFDTGDGTTDVTISDLDFEKECIRYFTDNKCNYPKITYDISFEELDMSILEGSNVDEISDIGMMDIVLVWNKKFNIKDETRVIETHYNPITEKYTSLVLGDPKSNLAEEFTDANRGEKGDPGEAGADGISIQSITNKYLATNLSTGVSWSTSGWTEDVPTISKDAKYLWNYEIITLTNNMEHKSDPCIIGTWGSDGADGADGKDGQDGKGIKSIKEYYAVSSSNTTIPVNWETTPPQMTPTLKYLWNYEEIEYTDGTKTQTTKKVIGVYGDQGIQGLPGKDGAAGKDGADGNDGIGISEIVNYYLAYTFNTGVTKTTPGWTEHFQDMTATKKYLWNYEKVTYTDSSTYETEPCVIGTYSQEYYTWIKYANDASGTGLSDDPTGKTYIGLAYNKTTATESTDPSVYTWSKIKGDKGDTGEKGAKGADGKTTYTWIKYSPYSNGAEMTDVPNENTNYIGIATNKTTATESTVKTDYTWSRFKGDQGIAGTDGEDGVGISSVLEFYAVSSSNTVPPDDWQGTPPAMTATLKYLWNYEKITFTNGSFKETSKRVIGVYGDKGDKGDKGDSVNTVDPDTLPAVPKLTVSGNFATIQVSWTFENKAYYTYEVYASQTSGFTPSTMNLLYAGQGSSCLLEAKPGQTWYFKARGKNTYGRTTSWSSQVSASTTKVTDMSNYFTSAAIGRAVVGSFTADYMTAGIIKGNWLDMKNVSVTDGNGKTTFAVTSDGKVSMDVTSLKINSNTFTKYIDVRMDAVKQEMSEQMLGHELLQYGNFIDASGNYKDDSWYLSKYTKSGSTVVEMASRKAYAKYPGHEDEGNYVFFRFIARPAADTAYSDEALMRQTFNNPKQNRDYILSFNAGTTLKQSKSSGTSKLAVRVSLNDKSTGTLVTTKVIDTIIDFFETGNYSCESGYNGGFDKAITTGAHDKLGKFEFKFNVKTASSVMVEIGKMKGANDLDPKWNEKLDVIIGNMSLKAPGAIVVEPPMDAVKAYVQSELTVLNDSINSKVSTDVYTTNKNNTDTLISNMQSQINQNSTEITSKVSQTTYDANNKVLTENISKIEQKANQIESTVSSFNSMTGEEVKSIIQQNPDSINIGFNKITEYIQMRPNEGITVRHLDGSFTRMSENGFLRYVNGTGHKYHSLTTSGTVQVKAQRNYTFNIILPDEFNICEAKELMLWTAPYNIFNNDDLICEIVLPSTPPYTAWTKNSNGNWTVSLTAHIKILNFAAMMRTITVDNHNNVNYDLNKFSYIPFGLDYFVSA